MKKIFLVLLVLFALVGAYVWFFVYNKSHVSIHDEEVVFDGSALELKARFFRPDGSLDSSLMTGAVIIQGSVTTAESSYYILDETVTCYLDSTLTVNPEEEKVRVKGRITGVQDDIIYGDLIIIQHAVPHLE